MNYSFRTLIPDSKSVFSVNHGTKILFIGSCFTEQIGGRMASYKFPVLINPAGIQYNPASISSVLQLIASGRKITAGDLFHAGGKWFSWLHHGSFSAGDRDECLTGINTRLHEAADFLTQTDFICMTFGTAYCYRLAADRRIVSNCHKQPAKLFTRERLSVDEIIHSIGETAAAIRKINPHARYLFTVSPVRHLKDGFPGNGLSKSILITAVHELCRDLSAEYFPAYEIMMDDLRDYRFYAEDMVHPNDTAVQYIWDRFQSGYMDGKTKQICKDLDPVISAMAHRPSNPASPEHQNFRAGIQGRIDRLSEEYPFLDLAEEKKHFAL